MSGVLAAPDEEAAAQEQRYHELADMERPYSHDAACRAPSKMTATQLKGRELDEEIAQGAAPAHLRHVSIYQPRFLRQDQGLTAAERGTAMHLVMQYLPFDTMPTIEAVAEVVESLRLRRLLTEQQAEAVDCGKLARFLASSLAEAIRQSGSVLREYRFALLMPASLYEPQLGDEEQMMLQGVVDCCYETDEGLVIVDFKTDRIAPGQEVQRAEVYRAQLEAYARALERVLEKKVCRKVFYFFATGTETPLD